MPAWQCSRCWRKYSFEEFNLLFPCWMDSKNHKYGKTSVCFCGAIFHKDKWHLTSFIDEYRISTVHLNLGSPDNSDYTSMKHLYFETMINKKEEWLSFQARYETMNQAIEGHFLAVDNLSKIILNPQRYPASIIDAFSNAIKAQLDQLKTIDYKLKERLK